MRARSFGSEYTATDLPAADTSLEMSMARDVLPVPTSPYSHTPLPASRFASRSPRYRFTSPTTPGERLLIGGLSKLRVRYFRGIADATPRARRRAMRRSRHSHGRATSSGPSIQPDPSQTPSGHGCSPALPDLARRTGFG